jgi:hypothetical protein
MFLQAVCSSLRTDIADQRTEFSVLSVPAACTLSIQNNLVPSDAKTGRNHFLQSIQARLRIKDTAAPIAMEVVVVTLAGRFVSWGFAWEINGSNHSILQQGLDIAIDGSDANAIGF